MTHANAIQLFEKFRHEPLVADQEKCNISIVDVIAILTDIPNLQDFWREMKKRLKKKEYKTVTNCIVRKMLAADGKMTLSNVADTQQLF